MRSIQVGKIQQTVIDALGLHIPANTPIYIGQQNIQHMQTKHGTDYEKYGSHISEILNTPDYVGLNPKDDSIEYVKEFIVDQEYVKVAVRVSTNGVHFARTLYILKTQRAKNFICKGTLHKIR